MDNNNKPNNPPTGGRPPRGPRPNNGQRPPRGGGNQRSGGARDSQGQTSSGPNGGLRKSSRGAAMRAQKRTIDDATRQINSVLQAPKSSESIDRPRANLVDDRPMLKIIALGGMDGGGSKNMIVIEYQNDAIITDCGNDLGVDLPGINYGICDVAYLETIKHKIRAYVITHGHLDHIGGLPHIVPMYPAPIYGGKFTIGRVQEIFQNFGSPLPEGFELKTVTMNEDTHEKLKVGEFFVELVRVTHSIPGSTVVVIDTPVGRVINTGDFRLDPNPLDHERTDTERLTALGEEGVLVLMSDSTTADRPGRTPSESTLEQTFVDIIDQAPGRIFVGLFSTNMNRVQMIVNAAVHHGRKVAMDGRSMVSTLEMAVRNGFMKIPKGTFVPIANIATLNDSDVVVVCTGSQGEPSSALQRMSNGEHRHIKLKEQDTVVFSSTPIPYSGNDAKVRAMVDDLHRKNVHVFQHITREVDNHGPLHVSGHGGAEEYKDMIRMTKPQFFIPIYGDFTAKRAHINLAIEEGIPRKNTVNAENGEIIAFTPDSMQVIGEVPTGTVLVDQSGAVVSGVVVKDRLILAEEGLVAVVLTIDKKTGQLMTSPDIISRGFIYMRDSEELMNGFRTELRRAVQQRFKRVDLDRFKIELKEHITHFLFEQTQRSPIVIPVVNVVGGGRPEGQQRPDTRPQSGDNPAPNSDPFVPTQKSAEQVAAEQQQRFQEMRAKLLNQDARTD
ncbi:ribonuclease J [soil metagenome]